MNNLTGKVCLVTGGTRGIGRATALLMAQCGADVIINYQNSKELADEVCERARKKGAHAFACQANIADESQVGAMLDKVFDQVGRVYILVNNAVITRDKSFLKMTRMLWDEVLGVNLN